jgi:imidazolonepropionase-like amidohydrolase
MLDGRLTMCLLGLAVTLATLSATAQTSTLVITGVNVVDAAAGRILPNSTVTISGDTIASLVSEGPIPAGVQVVDGRGKYLIPGLWDMHAHMEASGESWLPLHVANGVTGIRDMGSDLDVILRMRDATSSGRTLGPRIVAAGPILDDAPGNWPFRLRVRNAEEGRSAVVLLQRRGVDLIKVHNHTPRTAFFGIAEEARRQKLPLAGHVPMNVTAEEAVDAGMTNIEHLSEMRLWMPCSGGREYRRDACRPFFEMLARRGIWQTPTLGAVSELATIGTPASSISAEQIAYAGKQLRGMWAGNQKLFATPEVIRMMKARAQVAAVVTSDMAKAGVGILAGCDALIAGFCVHDELSAMVRAGMTPVSALQTATINPARYLGREKTFGSIAPGKVADLVLLDANPLDEIGNVRRIHAVVVAGRPLDRRELDRVLAQVKDDARP